MTAVPDIDYRPLVARARAGDRSAFAALVDGHYAALLGSCRRMLGDSELARDAAQEATVRALLSLDSLRDDRRFGAWLIGIGLNVCRSWLTGSQRRAVVAELAASKLSAPAVEADPFDLVVSGDLSRRVRAAIAQLPSGQRQAVVGFYLLGLTQAEIAEELNTGSGAVKTRLHKARTTLRATLKDIHEEQISMSDQPSLTGSDDKLIPLRVSGLRRTAPTEPGTERHLVFLGGPNGERLPIWIGAPEATAIALILEGIETPRPGAHQLTVSLIAGAGRRVAEVRLTDLTDSVFYAQVILDDGTTVDARPSDAITLALLSDAQISVRTAVIAEADRQWAERDALIVEADAAPDDQAAIAADALAHYRTLLASLDPSAKPEPSGD